MSIACCIATGGGGGGGRRLPTHSHRTYTRARGRPTIEELARHSVIYQCRQQKIQEKGGRGGPGATVHRDLRRTLVGRPRNVCVPLAIPGTEYNQRMAATWQRIGTGAVLMGSNRICGSFGPERFDTTGAATQPVSHTRPIHPWSLSLYCVS